LGSPLSARPELTDGDGVDFNVMDFVIHVIEGTRLIDDSKILVSSPVLNIVTSAAPELKWGPALPFHLAPDIAETEALGKPAVVLTETVGAIAIQKDGRESSVCVESFES
jgi:hypothetical protein